eukprot:COSAG01_NODE_10734_length_2092_cov_14.945309_1_plen_179_part_10
MGAADRPQRQLKPTQRARSGATRQTVTGVRPASKPIARRRKPKAKTSAATKVADAEEGTAPDIIMKEPDIPSIQEAAAEPATADGSEGADMEILEEELSEDDGGVLDVTDNIPTAILSKGTFVPDMLEEDLLVHVMIRGRYHVGKIIRPKKKALQSTCNTSKCNNSRNRLNSTVRYSTA